MVRLPLTSVCGGVFQVEPGTQQLDDLLAPVAQQLGDCLAACDGDLAVSELLDRVADGARPILCLAIAGDMGCHFDELRRTLRRHPAEP